MPEAYWLDQISDGTFSVTTTSGGTNYVAGVQSVAISGETTVERLFTVDSITVEAQKQHETTVDIEVGASLWDSTFVKQWLGGGGGTTNTSIEDTSDLQKFKLEVVTDSVAGGTTVTITVDNITFESMPVLDASRGEYVEWNPSGTGTTLSVTTA